MVEPDGASSEMLRHRVTARRTGMLVLSADDDRAFILIGLDWGVVLVESSVAWDSFNMEYFQSILNTQPII